MRFLIWCVGAMEILTAIMLARAVAPAWLTVWATLTVVWVLCGVVGSLLSVIRIATKPGTRPLPGGSAGHGKGTRPEKLED